MVNSAVLQIFTVKLGQKLTKFLPTSSLTLLIPMFFSYKYMGSSIGVVFSLGVQHRLKLFSVGQAGHNLILYYTKTYVNSQLGKILY